MRCRLQNVGTSIFKVLQWYGQIWVVTKPAFGDTGKNALFRLFFIKLWQACTCISENYLSMHFVLIMWRKCFYITSYTICLLKIYEFLSTFANCKEKCLAYQYPYINDQFCKLESSLFKTIFVRMFFDNKFPIHLINTYF